MKKLAIIIVSLAFSAPVFACPHEGGEAAAPKTAEKAKDEKGTADKAKAAPAPKKDEATTTAKKKDEPKQDTTKKPDKVSQN